MSTHEVEVYFPYTDTGLSLRCSCGALDEHVLWGDTTLAELNRVAAGHIETVATGDAWGTCEICGREVDIHNGVLAWHLKRQGTRRTCPGSGTPPTRKAT